MDVFLQIFRARRFVPIDFSSEHASKEEVWWGHTGEHGAQAPLEIGEK